MSGRHPKLLSGAWVSRVLLGIVVSGHGHRVECGHCYNRNGLDYVSYTGSFDPMAGFLLAGLSLAVFRS